MFYSRASQKTLLVMSYNIFLFDFLVGLDFKHGAKINLDFRGIRICFIDTRQWIILGCKLRVKIKSKCIRTSCYG